MIIFTYDKSFEGLLTCLFEAYERKIFPDLLQGSEEPLPLFYDQVVRVGTDENKAGRVWKGIEKRLSRAGLSVITAVWLSELPDTDLLLFRYMRKAFDSRMSIELNFGDADILYATQIAKKVSQERHRVIQFVRFSKTADNIFFAAVEPLYNVLPLTTPHFCDRFADQSWLVYDVKRTYGYFYDQKEVREVRFEEKGARLCNGRLADSRMAPQEQLFRRLWQTYFQATGIRERTNPRLHRQNMPVRFWKYLTEKQK